jgi:hypothetical protein
MHPPGNVLPENYQPVETPIGARFGLRPATKHPGSGAFPSPILGRYELNADFLNRLVHPPKFVGVALQLSRPY